MAYKLLYCLAWTVTRGILTLDKHYYLLGTDDSVGTCASAGSSAHANPAAAEQGGSHFFTQRGFDRPVGRAHATLFQLITFSWIGPLMQKGAKGLISKDMAEAFVDPPNCAQHLIDRFQAAYKRVRVSPPPTL